MMQLPQLTPPGFSIVPELRGSTLALRFRGTADMSGIEPLDEYLKAVHEVATSEHVTSVRVDFRGLEFMNSSCFKCFIEWLGNIQELPGSDRYKVVFESNREMHWQRRSLNALRSFAMDVVTVEAR